MSRGIPSRNLPVLLGSIRQEAGSGELVLEHNDGSRRFRFSRGELVRLRSEAAGEQFGSYLLRLGVIDLPTLRELLGNDEGFQIGEKVIQWGMMSLEERDRHLGALQELIMIHALEHPVQEGTWLPGPQEDGDPRFRLALGPFVWRTFHEADCTPGFLDLLRTEKDWTWTGNRERMDRLEDLPLTPESAYALSFLGPEAITFDAFRFLGRLEEVEASRLVAILWALGALERRGGALAPVTGAAPASPRPEAQTPAARTPAVQTPAARTPEARTPQAARPVLPLIPPPSEQPFGPPKPVQQRIPSEPEPLGFEAQVEYLESEQEVADRQGESLADPLDDWSDLRPSPMDVPPCGPPPAPRPSPLDMPPCGPRPVPRTAPLDMPPCGPRPVPRSAPLEVPPSGPLPVPGRPPAPEPPAEAPVRAPIENPFEGLSMPVELDLERRGVPTSQALEGQALARVLAGRARRQIMLGRSLEAIQTMEEVLRLEPDDLTAFEAWLTLGRLRSSNPSWSARALQALQNAARIRPAMAEPWLHMGELQRRQGAEAEAMVCFRKALERDPSIQLPVGIDRKSLAQDGSKKKGSR